MPLTATCTSRFRRPRTKVLPASSSRPRGIANFAAHGKWYKRSSQNTDSGWIRSMAESCPKRCRPRCWAWRLRISITRAAPRKWPPYGSSILLSSPFLDPTLRLPLLLLVFSLFAAGKLGAGLRMRIRSRQFHWNLRAFRFLLENGVERFQEDGLDPTASDFRKFRISLQHSVKIDSFIQQVESSVHVSDGAGNGERDVRQRGHAVFQLNVPLQAGNHS